MAGIARKWTNKFFDKNNIQTKKIIGPDWVAPSDEISLKNKTTEPRVKTDIVWLISDVRLLLQLYIYSCRCRSLVVVVRDKRSMHSKHAHSTQRHTHESQFRCSTCISGLAVYLVFVLITKKKDKKKMYNKIRSLEASSLKLAHWYILWIVVVKKSIKLRQMIVGCSWFFVVFYSQSLLVIHRVVKLIRIAHNYYFTHFNTVLGFVHHLRRSSSLIGRSLNRSTNRPTVRISWGWS